MKKIAVFIILISSYFISEAQETPAFEHVPKQYSVETGYRYNYSNISGYTASGYSLLLDYAWQLSGFKHKKAVYLSVPLAYTYFPKSASEETMSLLSYGWTVRHELARDKKLIPFISYGLLLNSLRVGDATGALMGHKTSLAGGFNFKMKRIIPFIRLEYSYTTFYQLNAESKHLQGVELALGIRM